MRGAARRRSRHRKTCGPIGSGTLGSPRGRGRRAAVARCKGVGRYYGGIFRSAAGDVSSESAPRSGPSYSTGFRKVEYERRGGGDPARGRRIHVVCVPFV